MWKMWHQGPWGGREGRGGPLPYPRGPSALQVPLLWGRPCCLGQGVPREDQGQGGGERGLPVPA
jgi:hypothetical protein